MGEHPAVVVVGPLLVLAYAAAGTAGAFDLRDPTRDPFEARPPVVGEVAQGVGHDRPSRAVGDRVLLLATRDLGRDPHAVRVVSVSLEHHPREIGDGKDPRRGVIREAVAALVAVRHRLQASGGVVEVGSDHAHGPGKAGDAPVSVVREGERATSCFRHGQELAGRVTGEGGYVTGRVGQSREKATGVERLRPSFAIRSRVGASRMHY